MFRFRNKTRLLDDWATQRAQIENWTNHMQPSRDVRGWLVAKADPLMIQAVREAAESFNDLLQIIVLESHALAQNGVLDSEAAERAARIERAARAAADLSRTIFGQGEGNVTRGA